MKKIVQSMLVCFGFLLLGLGVIGMMLPLLPTTPFFILAAVCFAKGSHRLHRWFVKTGFYLKYVEPAVYKKTMEKTEKRKVMGVLCLIFIISFFLVPQWYSKTVILAVALFHLYYFIFKIKTLPIERDTSTALHK